MDAVAIVNYDNAILAWAATGPIEGCKGFAVDRIDLGSGQFTALQSWVGFLGQTYPNWKRELTEVWPVHESIGRTWRPVGVARTALESSR